MTPEDIVELSACKEKLHLGAVALTEFVKLDCWHAARATVTMLDRHLRQIELIELQEKQGSKNSRDAATPREP